MGIVWRWIAIKIRNKLSIGVSFTVICIFIVGIAANILFLETYYIHEQQKRLTKTEKAVENMSLENMDRYLSSPEFQPDVVVVSTPILHNIDAMNEDLKWKFEQKKIKMSKFWITQQTIDDLKRTSVNKVYDQGISQHKVLVKFMRIENNVVAIARPITNIKETIFIVNQFNIILMSISVVLILIFVWLMSKKITKPLNDLKELSKDIANLNFRTQEINTHDEIWELSQSINAMSIQLEKAHKEINNKNVRLKELLADVSHELKTPLSLISAYEQGRLDGLDDGSYGHIIKEQIQKMDTLIEKLLFSMKLDRQENDYTVFDLCDTIQNVIAKYKIILKQNDISLDFIWQEQEAYSVYGDASAIEVVLDNLISNAIKYTNNKTIQIILEKREQGTLFTISNGISFTNETELENIWKPFYVLEKSRSKDFSGTGLGLPIVKDILNNHNLDFGCYLKNSQIVFYVTFL